MMMMMMVEMVMVMMMMMVMLMVMRATLYLAKYMQHQNMQRPTVARWGYCLLQIIKWSHMQRAKMAIIRLMVVQYSE